MEQLGPIAAMFNEGTSRELQQMEFNVPPQNGQQPPPPFEMQQQQPMPGNELQEQQPVQQLDPNNMLPQQQIDPNMMQGQAFPLDQQPPPNAEQHFYNEFMDKFHGLEGGSINGANDVNVSDAMSSFGFNALILVILIVSYEIISRFIPSVYASRKLHVSDDRVAIEVPKSCFPCNWVPSVIRASWHTVRKCGGLDAYFFLRFIAMCFRITAVSGFWGVMILWPIFASGGDGAVGWYHYSMANVRSGSERNWAPALFMWLMTFHVLHVMNEEYKHYLELRMQYLSEGDIDMNPQTQHSLMVEEIPRELRSDRALFQYFDTLYPGKVHSATVVLNIPELEKVAAKRKRAVRRLEKSNAYYEATGRRGTHVVGRQRCRCFGIETFPIIGFGGTMSMEDDDYSSPQRGTRVDSINYYKNQLDDLNCKVEIMQQEKRRVMEEGNDRVSASEWISNIYRMTSGAVRKRSSTTNGLLVGFQDKVSTHSPSVFKQVSIDFFFGGLQFLNRNIDVVVESVSRSTLSSTGYVTFTDTATVVAAGKTPHSHDPDILRVSIAPDPRDIIWENAHINDSFNKGREWTANLIIGFGAILWSTVVASIQAWATVDKISTVPGFHWMNTFNVDTEFSSFVNGYLPVVALLVIISLLPLMFETIAHKFEYRKTKSDVQNSMLGRYFYYQLANIYVTVTAGSIWTSLGAIVDHPGSIFEILGKSIPNLVGFFVTLLMTKTLAGLPMTMLRITALLRQVVLRLVFKQKLLTQRELDEVYKRETLLGGWQYPNILFVVVICFTYACISPIILPFGAIFFLGALVVFKKQVLLVYTPEHESGGTMFPSACKRVLIGLICGQVTLIGYMILRASFYQPLFLLPLPFITYKMIQSFHRIYQVPSAQLSLERASQLDQKSMVKIRFDEDLYRQPVMAEGRLDPLPYRIAAHTSHTVNMTSSLGVLNINTGKIV